jgi:hypothetical protein
MSSLWHFPAANDHVVHRVIRAGAKRRPRFVIRSLLLALRLKDEVLAVVPNRQWVFTIPKRLRVYFRYDRKLLGKLCRAAYDTVCDVFKLEIDGESGVPAMIGAVQTFGDLVH